MTRHQRMRPGQARTGAARPSHRLWLQLRRDDGMNTAEYAVGTIAAVAFAALLLRVLTSDRVRDALTAIIERALQ